jgi:hypothetical protein
MRQYATHFAAIFVALISTSAWSQQTSDSAVAPFIDDQTLVVVRIDTEKVNPAGMIDWVTGKLAQQHVEQPGIDLLRRSWQPRVDRATTLLTGLRNANATRLYWILSVSDFSGARSVSNFWDQSRDKGVWAVPLPAGSDGEAVVRLLAAEKTRNGMPPFESTNFGDVAVAAARGHLPHAGVPQLSPGWAQALAGDAPIQLAVCPGTTLRRASEENIGGIPTANGSVPITTFTRDVQWLALSLAQPPASRLSVVIQATDPAAAGRVNDAMKQVLAALHGQKIEMPFWVPPLENVDTFVSFRIEGSELKWTPDAGVIESLVVRKVSESINLLAAGNMKQILLGSIMYANTHREFPPDIPTLLKDQDMSPVVTKDPLHPQDAVGYIYVKPNDWQKDAEKTPVLYEKWEGGKLVAFADGHVETMESRAAVEKLIQERQRKN